MFMRGNLVRRSMFAAAVVILSLNLAGGGVAPARAQAAGCQLDDYRTRIDRTLASIEIERRTETALKNGAGAAVRAVDFGLSGDIDGCVVLQGPLAALQPNYSWLYDVPDVSLPQEHLLAHDRRIPYPLPLKPDDGNTSPRYLAKGRFLAEQGAGMNLFLPAKTQWNGRLFIVQRGSGIYDPMKEPAVRSPSDPFPSRSGANAYAENMVDRGYAVAYYRKDAVRPPLGVTKVRLADGREVTVSYVAQVAIPLAFAEFAQKQVGEALGRPPEKTYYYGHSGGGITGRLINYSGANVARNGRPIIDGLIHDDAGNGLYLPVLFRDGEDVLFATAAERARFVPQIDIARKIYNPLSYLAAKRANEQLLADKRIGWMTRYYEIRAVSHFDAGMMRMILDDVDPKQRVAGADDPVNYLDLSGLMTAMIDNLDLWVSNGVAPPPSSRTVTLPEVSCPLGAYYIPPGNNGQITRLAVFDGTAQRPFDVSKSDIVDDTGIAAPVQAETVTAAWRRLGLVGANETVNRERYLGCMQSAAAALIAEHLLPKGAEPWYRARGAMLLEKTGAKLN